MTPEEQKEYFELYDRACHIASQLGEEPPKLKRVKDWEPSAHKIYLPIKKLRQYISKGEGILALAKQVSADFEKRFGAACAKLEAKHKKKLEESISSEKDLKSALEKIVTLINVHEKSETRRGNKEVAMKQELPKFGYMVIVTSSRRIIRLELDGLCNMVRFEKGRAVLRHGMQLVVPTIFINRKKAEAAISREKMALRFQEKIWKADIEYMRNRNLFKKYPGVLEVMKMQAKGTLCGTFRPIFRVRKVNIEKWKELLNGYDLVVKGDRLVERRKGEKES